MDEGAIIRKWRELLGAADLEKTSERQLRVQLSEIYPDLELENKESATGKAWKSKLRAETEAYLAESQAAEEEEEEEEKPQKKKAGGGWGKACLLSPPLAAFVKAERMARSDVVKCMWDYIKANNLQNPKDKREIICDDKLKTIFKPPVNMFSMNKQLALHIHTDGDVATGASKKSASKRPPASSGRSSSKKSRRGDDDDDDDDSFDDDDRDDDEDFKPKRAGGGGKGGFMKPVTVSAELAEWLGVSEITRSEVTKHFFAYVKANNLHDPSNKRYVICDDLLERLTGEKRVLAFGIQKHLARHFIKKEP